MEEKTFFEHGDIKITNARFISAGQTYAMNNVTSVKSTTKKPKRMWLIVMLVVGLLMLPSMKAEPMAVGGVIAAVAGFCLYRQRPEYNLMLTTAAGEASALTTNNREFLERVLAALNEAIVYRG